MERLRADEIFGVSKWARASAEGVHVSRESIWEFIPKATGALYPVAVFLCLGALFFSGMGRY